MTLSQDILAELAEIAIGSPLDQARAIRDAATRHAQGSYEVLFSQQDTDFPLDERFAVAAKVAKLHQADALAAHYAGFGLADPTTDRLVPALAFARLLTFTPVEATPAALHRHPGAAGGLYRLPKPPAAGPAGAQPSAHRQRRHAGGGRVLAHHPTNSERQSGPGAFHP